MEGQGVQKEKNMRSHLSSIFKLGITISLCLTVLVLPQTKTEFFPFELNFQPLTANTLEPKLGFLFHLDDNLLRLDVGNSADIYRISYDGKAALSFGADLFTYSRLRSEDNFKFPVEAIDYLFGLNTAYVTTTNGFEIGARLRLSHISAHLVDGRFNKHDNTWIDGRKPFVYSKEFVELTAYYKFHDLRLYGGLTYNYNIAPGLLGKDQYQTGFDYFNSSVFGKQLNPFLGYDFRIANLDEYTYNHNLVAGIKIGKRTSKGFSLFFNYYSGRSFHGELYDTAVSYYALGMNFDI